MGRKRLEAAGTVVRRLFSFGPEQWKRIEKWIPKRERSALVRRCLEREAHRRERLAQVEGDGSE
jgi:hypothetical protein